ncbi:sigma-54 dependent transcriptional regulator [Idiomarina xiamenensis]|nr:sigma-54 dependent transcriptional regulator [Idiomarina xiamenensis]
MLKPQTVYLLEETHQRSQQLQTLLEFVGERVERIEPAALAEKSDSQAPLCVIAGDCARELIEIAKEHPAIPFISAHEKHSNALSLANVVGEINDNVQYPMLTQLLHYCQQYHRQQPRQGQPKSPRLLRTLVGKSRSINIVRKLITQVADTDASVLILGESGTGKEVVARNIHDISKRRDGPFVPVNCGAIPAELLESELFGHEKGAFTGAISTRKGRFELAQGGTLFLDEIGDMPLNMQVKLLRVLQERCYERVGGNKPIQADVRIVAATHRELEQMIIDGDFREDLYYRLNVFPIEMPALRERQEDVPLILQELVSRFSQQNGAQVRFTDNAMASLSLHRWPGNVRELANLVERMAIIYPDSIVDVSDLPPRYQHIDAPEVQPEYPEELLERQALSEIFATDDDGSEPPQPEPAAISAAVASALADSQSIQDLPPEGVNLKDMLSNLEKDLIRQALEIEDWVVARAAEKLGMRRTTLVEKMRKYQLARDEL